MFELRTATKVKVLNVGTLVQKDRKADELPGAQLTLQMLLPVAAMAMFDGRWPGILAEPAHSASQGSLDGMEGVEPTSLAKHLKKTSLDYFQTGVALVIDRGMGGKRNIVLDDCTMHSVSFLSPQSGGVKLNCKIDAPALTDATRGTLSGLKATEIDMLLTGPVVDDSQQTIPGTEGTDPNAKPAGGWPFPKNGGKGGAEASSEPQDATEAFTQAHGAPEHPPERKVGETTVITRRSRTSPPPAAH